MTQINIAMGMDTLAYSNFPNVSGIAGQSLPMPIPATMHKPTHKLR